MLSRYVVCTRRKILFFAKKNTKEEKIIKTFTKKTFTPLFKNTLWSTHSTFHSWTMTDRPSSKPIFFALFHFTRIVCIAYLKNLMYLWYLSLPFLQSVVTMNFNFELESRVDDGHEVRGKNEQWSTFQFKWNSIC